MDKLREFEKQIGISIESYKNFEKRINYQFKNPELLIKALTHGSFSNENPDLGLESYERLEFFGDAVLQLVVSEMLLYMEADFDEGDLTKTRSLVVCESTLTKCAYDLKLNELIIMSRGEVATGGRERSSILADVVESLIAAIYLDSDLDAARTFVKSIINKYIELAKEGKICKDYKSALQEYVQGNSKENIKYTLIKSKGPDHNILFEYGVFLGQTLYGKGIGKTKKEAQQNAAQQALSVLKEEENEW